MKQIDKAFIKCFGLSGMCDLDREYMPTILRITPDEKKRAFISEIRGTVRDIERKRDRSLLMIDKCSANSTSTLESAKRVIGNYLKRDKEKKTLSLIS